MKTENIKKVTNQAIEQLTEALNAGHSEALSKYLAAMAKFRAYSFLNVLLILKACPNAKHVAGYKTWQSLGRQVRQGERGIMILAPIFRKKTESTSEATAKDDEGLVAGYRAVYVWDEQQTTGRPLPEIGQVTGDPSAYLARLEQYTRKCGISLTYSDSIAPARGMAERGKITLLPGLSAAESFATLAHELAHADLHLSERRADTNKRLRETEAESVAYVVCSAIGLDPGTASRDYIGLYGGDAKLLMESLEYVQATASRILEGIESVPLQQAA
jgi:antirestriction protein ArdC